MFVRCGLLALALVVGLCSCGSVPPPAWVGRYEVGPEEMGTSLEVLSENTYVFRERVMGDLVSQTGTVRRDGSQLWFSPELGLDNVYARFIIVESKGETLLVPVDELGSFSEWLRGVGRAFFLRKPNVVVD